MAGGLCRVLESTASRSRRTWAATATWLVSLTMHYAEEVSERGTLAGFRGEPDAPRAPVRTLGLTFVPASRQDMTSIAWADTIDY